MNVYGKFTAAVGSVALNVALALILSQQAGATTSSSSGAVQEPHGYTLYLASDQHSSHGRCVSGMRARTIIAVLLSLIV